MPEKRKIKQQITQDFILDEYERIKKIKSKKKRDEQLEVLKTLTENIGGYITSSIK